MEMKAKQTGFTLIELVVVIVILGILAAVAIPKLQSLDVDAKKAVNQGAAAAMQSAAVITYAKTKTANSFADILAQTVLPAGVTITGTCADATAKYDGAAAADFNFTIPSDLCT